jgi:hypothetical protein
MARRKIAVPGALARRLHLLKRNPRQQATRGSRGGITISYRTLYAIGALALAAIGMAAWLVGRFG